MFWRHFYAGHPEAVLNLVASCFATGRRSHCIPLSTSWALALSADPILKMLAWQLPISLFGQFPSFLWERIDQGCFYFYFFSFPFEWKWILQDLLYNNSGPSSDFFFFMPCSHCFWVGSREYDCRVFSNCCWGLRSESNGHVEVPIRTALLLDILPNVHFFSTYRNKFCLSLLNSLTA